eukprot:CAMPEP_0172043572 /NCGR_PEP_ID=MMETSP1041-20130122/26337_1 /TAXON_ID=464988 /ORGANISM="Hemiselmis andersenii, Strain CCMP439" /LENGTH=138 /DNA_ID=CAMNT_0012702013 /DNA_START=58 /DNA_END=474 /DNA_ORIENTATION=+
MPTSVPIRKDAGYETEYSHRVGKHGWNQSREDTEHCRRNTDVTAIPSVRAEDGAVRPMTPVRSEESIAVLECYRQARAMDRDAVQRRRAAASLTASRTPSIPDHAADALSLVQELRRARVGRLEEEKIGLYKAVYRFE